MSIKSILITGGGGYVGAILVPQLLQKNYRVKVIDWYIYESKVFNKYKKNAKLIQIKGDIRDKKLLEKSLKGTDAVIHLACISNDPSFELKPSLGKSINYDATLHLVDLAKQNKIKRFIYASTSSVYGIKKEKEVTENLTLEPLTDYSKYKGLCEDYVLSKQGAGFTVVVLRPATVCGYSPRLRLDLTVNMLTLQALVNKKITVFGGGQKRPNIHIEDMVDIYIRMLEYPKRKIAGKIYNVGYQNYTVLEIAKKIKKTLKDSKIEIIVLPSNDKRSYSISSEKIRKELGFEAKFGLEHAIIDLRQAYENGKIRNPFDNILYYNIKTMKKMFEKGQFL